MKAPPRTMAALITPFDEHGSIDDAAHRHNLIQLAQWGLNGFLIGGSTGQGPYLEPGERGVLTATARDQLGSSAFLLTGISAQSVRQAEQQIAEAADAEADAVLVTTPTLLLRKNAELVESFYSVVADFSPLPVLGYSVPAVTGYELPVESAVTICAHPNVVGMKDSGGDPDRIGPILEGMREGQYFFVGASRIVHEAFARGAYGSITASGNYAPELAAAARESADAQDRLSSIASNVEWHGLAGTYAAAGMVGLRTGTMRAPLIEMAAEQREAMRAVCCPVANR
ncbi:MAG: dihydrodipicolinate synthase family protein [Acidimicrobiia bacterium]